MLKLVKPNARYREEYKDMLEKWNASGETPFPWMLQLDYSDMGNMIKKLKELEKGINVPEGLVPCTTYWAYDAEKCEMVGAVNVRHYLNTDLFNTWGYIGFGVRPDERRKGYANEMLKQALIHCKSLPVKKVIIGCYNDNVACVKAIIKNGGILENEYREYKTGKVIQRYWIDIKK